MRYDITTNAYSTREIYKTNFEGEASLNLILNEEFYQFVVEYPFGTIKKTTIPSYVYDTSLEIQILIGEDVGERFYNTLETTKNITFNNLTNSFRFFYSDPNNLLSGACLKVYRLTRAGKDLVNSSCTTSSSGNIVLKVANITGATYLAEGYFGFSPIDYFVASVSHTYSKINPIGKTGLLFVGFLTLTFAFIGYYSITLMILITPLPTLFASFGKLINIPWGAAVALQIIAIIIAIMVSRRER